MRMVFLLFLVVVQAGWLAGCTPIGVAVSAGAMAGSVALEERSMEDSLRDRGIALEINELLAKESGRLFANVSVDVVEGRVLLTGAVAREEDRLEALKLTWKVDDVEEVINEIQVTKDGDITELSRDTLTKTRLASEITFDRDVKAVNYEISVVNGTVYLFGIAENQMEVDQVIAHARDLPYVRHIVSHMRMKDDPARLDRLKAQNDDSSES
ncbi:BON domain-containing protein [Aestuariispira ectoiniformans]|uniref:BON domain-containing protein n=1 Tax=Aestuariispira ectoiniformans TaxID=2775080 RepID=UPI00223BF0D3|nr:BON domain-containing protein [Aestuariispira ectoiniformans]